MDAFFISLCELLICIDSIEKSIFTFSKYVPFFNHRNQRALKKANKLKKIISSKRLNKFHELATIVQQSVGGLAEFLSVKQEDIYIDKYFQNQQRFFTKTAYKGKSQLKFFKSALPIVEFLLPQELSTSFKDSVNIAFKSIKLVLKEIQKEAPTLDVAIGLPNGQINELLSALNSE